MKYRRYPYAPTDAFRKPRKEASSGNTSRLFAANILHVCESAINLLLIAIPK